MKTTPRLFTSILFIAFGFTTQIFATDTPAKRRLLFTEYGKGPNRFVELDGEGKLVWEWKTPSTAVLFQTLPNGNILFGYGGQPTGVRAASGRRTDRSTSLASGPSGTPENRTLPLSGVP